MRRREYATLSSQPSQRSSDVSSRHCCPPTLAPTLCTGFQLRSAGGRSPPSPSCSSTAQGARHTWAGPVLVAAPLPKDLSVPCCTQGLLVTRSVPHSQSLAIGSCDLGGAPCLRLARPGHSVVSRALGAPGFCPVSPWGRSPARFLLGVFIR